jgi:hypothetical protein
MYTFGSLVALILIVEIGCTVTIFMFKDDVWTAVNGQLIEGLVKYGNEDNKGMTDSWDKLQSEMKCCGVKDYTDWSQVDTFNNSSSVPDSCCTAENIGEDCGNGQLNDATQIYTAGCLTKLGTVIKENLIIVGVAGAGIVVLQLIGVIVACCLGRRMKDLQNFV